MTITEKKPLLESTSERPGTDRSNLKFLLVIPPLVLYYVSFGMSFYVTNEWVQQFVQTQVFTNITFNETSVCDRSNESDHETVLYERVESDTARWQMLFSLGLFVPATIASAILPAYTDCFGRRFILLTATTGCAIKYAIMTATIYFNLTPILIVVGSAIDGLTGTYFSLYAGSFSYVADLTEMGRRRTFVMTMLDGTLLISITLSCLGAGYFIHWFGFFISMACSSGLIVLALLFLIVFVPESYPKHARSNTLSLISVVKRTFDFYVTDAFKAKRSAYLILIAAYVFQDVASMHRGSTEMLYQLGRPFCWSAEKIGNFSGVRTFAQGITGMILIRPLQTCLSDLKIAMASLVIGAGSYVLEALANTDLMLYMVPVLAAFSFLCETMVKSLMSSMTPPDKQGSLFASIVMAQGVCAISSNFLLTTVYASTVSFMSGFVFYVMAGLMTLSLIFLIIYSILHRNKMSERIQDKEINQ